MSKKLAIAQLAMVGISIIFVIIFLSSSTRVGLFDYTGAGTIGVLLILMFVGIIIIGIIQIVFGAKEKNGVGLAAGITSLLSFIPLVGIAAFILDIIVVARKKQ